jgi:hypothetical protein
MPLKINRLQIFFRNVLLDKWNTPEFTVSQVALKPHNISLFTENVNSEILGR